VTGEIGGLGTVVEKTIAVALAPEAKAIRLTEREAP
jgi:hypothetical protein